jgi:hypothetical protein
MPAGWQVEHEDVSKEHGKPMPLQRRIIYGNTRQYCE